MTLAESRGESRRICFEEFQQRAFDKHGYGRYRYDSTSYVITHSKVNIECLSCSRTFKQEAKAHMAGQGCPSCTKTGYSPERTNILYILRVLQQGTRFIGFGITGNLKNRLRTHRRNLIAEQAELLEISSFCFEQEGTAFNIERELIRESTGLSKIICPGFLRESMPFSEKTYGSLIERVLQQGGRRLN